MRKFLLLFLVLVLAWGCSDPTNENSDHQNEIDDGDGTPVNWSIAFGSQLTAPGIIGKGVKRDGSTLGLYSTSGGDSLATLDNNGGLEEITFETESEHEVRLIIKDIPGFPSPIEAIDHRLLIAYTGVEIIETGEIRTTWSDTAPWYGIYDTVAGTFTEISFKRHDGVETSPNINFSMASGGDIYLVQTSRARGLYRIDSSGNATLMNPVGTNPPTALTVWPNQTVACGFIYFPDGTILTPPSLGGTFRMSDIDGNIYNIDTKFNQSPTSGEIKVYQIDVVNNNGTVDIIKGQEQIFNMNVGPGASPINDFFKWSWTGIPNPVKYKPSDTHIRLFSEFGYLDLEADPAGGISGTWKDVNLSMLEESIFPRQGVLQANWDHIVYREPANTLNLVEIATGATSVLATGVLDHSLVGSSVVYRPGQVNPPTYVLNPPNFNNPIEFEPEEVNLDITATVTLPDNP